MSIDDPKDPETTPAEELAEKEAEEVSGGAETVHLY
jgi:hypothetical protein